MKLFRYLAIIVLMLVFTGCNQENEVKKEEPKKESTTMMVQDTLGRSVEIPSSIERIATVNVDAFRMIVQLGAEDKLVGIPSNMYGSKFSKEKTIETLAFSKLEETPQVGGGQPGSEMNIEKVMDTDPDVFIIWSFSRGENKDNLIEQADQLQEQLGTPVLAINTLDSERNLNKVMKNIEKTYTLMGKIVGEEKRAKQLIDYYEEQVKEVTNRIKNEPKPNVYLANRTNLYSNNSFYVPIEQLGVTNVASKRAGQDGEISAEQLIEWNPDYIFLHTISSGNRIEMDSIYNDNRLSDITAIKNKDIYRFKGTYMGWDIATGLVDLVYMGKIMFPYAMNDVSVEEKGEEILQFFYDTEGLYDHLSEQSDYKSWEEK